MILLSKKGLSKKVSTGFSWKALLFGVLYPLFRGDYRGFFRHFMYSSLTIGASWFFTPFFYNSKYIKELIEKGSEPENEKSLSYLEKKFRYKASDELIAKLRG